MGDAGSRQALEEIAEVVNQDATAAGLPHKTVEEVALGFIDVANEAMCRPIRALTQARGFDVSAHVLACFGGAGGQHACAIARQLGMKTVFVHRYASILSAVGMGLASVVQEGQVCTCHMTANLWSTRNIVPVPRSPTNMPVTPNNCVQLLQFLVVLRCMYHQQGPRPGFYHTSSLKEERRVSYSTRFHYSVCIFSGDVRGLEEGSWAYSCCLQYNCARVTQQLCTLQGKVMLFTDCLQVPVACTLEDSHLNSLKSQLDKLQSSAESDLKGRGFQPADLSTVRYLNLRFQGTDVALMVAAGSMADYKPAFLRMYQQEFGFVLQDRDIIVDDARCATLCLTKCASPACIHIYADKPDTITLCVSR